MDADAAREFVRENHRAVLATRRRDGGPQLSPVTVGVADDGLIIISSRLTAYKVRNIQRDPAVELCVLNDGFFGAWAQISGQADIVELPAAMDGLIAYYRGISGEHPDWDDYRAAMVRDQRCLIRVTIESAGPSRSG
ncbi:PPOX class F420-dependent oxidoreductase [Frankia sp. CNm7]|uniref:PPOX class F420-dependent oxidoreductase n=1 Tax=Frankia nepalensis TaxID=1836974 RepID=A0A937RFP1_9ACTN|nr:PPOX class F420-dependent oxidoreductase [Frankia nepalensis]MBL7498581.1 PPOX class F420-dependent oxidoreductase [Frankia nepalensis]MBL7515040.1 PPOX class F420-dependent oxidoreductase [Frankia nepalensis]MBL7519414.1 PPOX class F420-dependent oxidoreductase [Frankia nepalensis]MBL7629172.1 PPOX class F420-dependent oxidoreductase [Frankia nepalensis]